MEKIKSEFVVTRQFGQMLGYAVLSVEQIWSKLSPFTEII